MCQICSQEGYTNLWPVVSVGVREGGGVGSVHLVQARDVAVFVHDLQSQSIIDMESKSS